MSVDIENENSLGKVRTSSGSRVDFNALLSSAGPNEAIAGFSVSGMRRAALCYVHLAKALMISEQRGTKVFLNSIGKAECEICRENKRTTGRIYYE